MKEIIYLKYKLDINNSKKIKLFGDNFVEKNRGKCTYSIDGKEFDLVKEIDIPKNKKPIKFIKRYVF